LDDCGKATFLIDTKSKLDLHLKVITPFLCGLTIKLENKPLTLKIKTFLFEEEEF